MIKYINKNTCYIDDSVVIEDNVTIYPNVVILGNSIIKSEKYQEHLLKIFHRQFDFYLL